jgi:hypothetical protein
MMKIRYTLPEVFMLLLIIQVSSCDRKSKPTEFADEYLENLTLSSLTRVNDYPLFLMTYYGDYGFGEFLKTGARVPLNITPPVNDGWGCTCFSVLGNENGSLLGRNIDWLPGTMPLILFTDPPDGFASVSVVDLNYFGYARENPPDLLENRDNLLDTPWMPFDGMNENGVAIGMMAVSHAKSPYDPSRITLGEIELIRLVLDYAMSVEDAITLINRYNIRMEETPIHYMIAEPSGRSVIIEFLNGEMKVIPNTRPWQVSTNFILSEFDDPGQAGCWRFDRVCSILDEIGGSLTVSSSMEILERASQPNTIWSVVYNMNSGDIGIATGREFSSTLHYNFHD